MGPARTISAAVTFAILVAWTSAVPAQEKSTVDLYRGPIVSSSRVVGLGGAYTGLAEGVQGLGQNAASLGNRYPYSTDWFDWDVSLDWMNLLPGDSIDMDNDGLTSGDEEYTALAVGLGLLFGNFGVGLRVTGDSYSLARGSETINFSFTRGFAGLSYAFWRQQLVVGLGTTFVAMTVETLTKKADAGNGDKWESDAGGSWESDGGRLGVLWRPAQLPIRVGLDLSAPVTVPVSVDDASGQLPIELVPGKVYSPWRVAVGASYFYSPSGRRFNVERTASDNPFARKPPKNGKTGKRHFDRRYLLAVLDVVLSGPAPDGAVGSGAFATGALTPSGENGSWSVHGGLESEVISDRLAVRSGTYLEPPRLQAAEARLHGTFGADVKLFRLWRWKFRAGFSFDIARDYVNWGIGIGFWH
jgi:hypothetical protein